MTRKTPTALVKLHGKPNNAWRENVNEPKSEYPVGDPPEELSLRQKEIWIDAAKHAAPGLLTYDDRQVFMSWVIAVDLMHTANFQIYSKNRRLTTPAGRISGHVNLLLKAQTAVLRACSQLGFTPVSRPGINAVPKARDTGRRMSRATIDHEEGPPVISIRDFLASTPEDDD